MKSIGLQDMPADAIEALRSAPSVLRTVVHLSRGEEGRIYVRIEHPAIERKDLERLMTSPLFARITGPAPLTLVFDPDAAAPADRERRREQILAELRQVAPEIVRAEEQA